MKKKNLYKKYCLILIKLLINIKQKVKTSTIPFHLYLCFNPEKTARKIGKLKFLLT